MKKLTFLVLSLVFACSTAAFAEDEKDDKKGEEAKSEDTKVLVSSPSSPDVTGTGKAGGEAALGSQTQGQAGASQPGTFSGSLTGTVTDPTGMPGTLSGSTAGVLSKLPDTTTLMGNTSGTVTDRTGKTRPFVGVLTGVLSEGDQAGGQTDTRGTA